MEEACKKAGLTFIKLIGDLKFIKTGDTHLSNYNAYSVYYNESISGVNIMDFDIAATWCIGNSFYSTKRLYEFKNRREEALHIQNLKKWVNKTEKV